LGDLIHRNVSLRSFFIVNWVRETPGKEIEETYAELADQSVCRSAKNSSRS
jgi:hypothetical protein